MSENRDELEELLAAQLAAQLEGEEVAEVDADTTAIAAFAKALPWEEVQPDPLFRGRLRRDLLKRPAAKARSSRFERFSLYAVAGVVVVVVVLALLVVSGPPTRNIFGLVYNSLSAEPGYERDYMEARTLALKPNAGDHTGYAAPTPLPAAVTAKPLSSPAPVPAEGGGQPPAGPANPALADHKIVKNAQMMIVVADTDVAIDRITGIVAQYSGYLLSSQTWYNEGYKEATMVLSVPADTFEQVLRRLREIASRVESETASGQDVTDQYVDLESQLRNLEATAARLRTFLDKAQTVKEALDVNAQLSGIEGQIEQVKGKMQYIEGRSAYSTITIEIRTQRPTPTPTPTQTPTPTPTPQAWRPGQTYEQASGTLTSIFHSLVEALIWVGVVLVPVLGVPALVVLAVVWTARRVRRSK